MPPRTIDHVLDELNAIIDQAIKNAGRIGYFAALYARVTSNVRRAILAGNVFQDNARMDRFDVIFADRFLDAWKAWKAHRPLSRSWAAVFEVLDRPDAIVAQHLLLGMTVHIGLDLGVTAAQVGVSTGGLRPLRADFLAINDVLSRLLDVVQAELATCSPRLHHVGRIAPELQDRAFDFSMAAARDDAWTLAERLVAAPLERRPRLISARDEAVLGLVQKIYPPQGALGPVVRWIHEEESKAVKYNIQVIAG